MTKNGTLVFFSAGGTHQQQVVDMAADILGQFFEDVRIAPSASSLMFLGDPEAALEELVKQWQDCSEEVTPSAIVFGAYVPDAHVVDSESAQRCAVVTKRFVENHLYPLLAAGVSIFVTAEYASMTGIDRILDPAWMREHTSNPGGGILSRGDDMLNIVGLLTARPATEGVGSAGRLPQVKVKS